MGATDAAAPTRRPGESRAQSGRAQGQRRRLGVPAAGGAIKAATEAAHRFGPICAGSLQAREETGGTETAGY
eukprot:7663658-Pyramimonas_sp.AAC.1